MALVPAFRFDLKNTVVPGMITVGKCNVLSLFLLLSINRTVDGEHPNLACATVSGKVFIHDPFPKGVDEESVRFLNINQKITALNSGEFTGDNKSKLLVGTQTNLLV
jgi:hypothetical protein